PRQKAFELGGFSQRRARQFRDRQREPVESPAQTILSWLLGRARAAPWARQLVQHSDRREHHTVPPNRHPCVRQRLRQHYAWTGTSVQSWTDVCRLPDVRARKHEPPVPRALEHRSRRVIRDEDHAAATYWDCDEVIFGVVPLSPLPDPICFIGLYGHHNRPPGPGKFCF